MSKPNPNSQFSSLTSQDPLIDSLTSHISLYNSHSTTNPNPNPNPRSAVLKWFKSLSVHHRQAHLTAVDPKFVRVLLQMLRKLKTNGHGCFIILPDLPSGDLPTLCFKRSGGGLVARVAESDDSGRTVAESTRLFSSKEGENVEECSCSVREIDSLTVAEELVEDLDTFVAVMDAISSGEFLRGEESDLGDDWVELKWLKDKGYYCMEAFVANRLEVALRLAWMNSNNGRKRGVKLKEKANAAGVAANVYWRKKGCVDWWGNLDSATRRNVMTSVLGKAAKPLIYEILKLRSSGVEDDIWLFNTGVEQPLRYHHNVSMCKNVLKHVTDTEFGSSIVPASLSRKPASLTDSFHNLFVLQDIIMMISSFHHGEYDKGKFFYSTLSSISTISDFILRKVRGLLMVILLDCTKLELLAEGNEKHMPKKPKAKPSSRKSKGKGHNMKRPNLAPRSCPDDFLCETSVKDLNFTLAHKDKAEPVEFKEMGAIHQEMEILKESSSSKTPMEHVQTLPITKVQTAGRKGRKGKGKNKITGLKNSVAMRKFDGSVMEASFCSSLATPDDTTEKSAQISGDSTFQNATINNLASCSIPMSSSNLPGSANGPTEEEDAAQSIQENDLVGSCANVCHRVPEDYQPLNNSTEVQTKLSLLETETCKVDGNSIHSPVPAEENNVSSLKDIDLQDKTVGKFGAEEVSPDKDIRASDVKKDAVLQDQQIVNNICDTGAPTSFECLSYEWPGVACAYFPPVNPHLPPATDRLHLDVGHNWQNHFSQSFVPTIHQVRNSPIEGRCNPVLPRPLPMSLDWPPMIRSARRLFPYRTCNYDSGFISKKQCSFPQGFPHAVQINTAVDDGRKYSWDCTDLPDPTKAYELADECDSHWISEDEVEVQAFPGADYNQYFGGGVMYWNPSEHSGTVFSRPPSLSSDDSSWAWREADMNRTVDDMVAFSSPYSTNGLTSPTASFCSPFDPLGSGNQPIGYVMPGNEVPAKVLHPSTSMPDTAADEESSGSLVDVTGDVEGKTGDSLPYPILRPIIIERSREFKRNHDRKSPCVPPTMRDQPRVKRPPSPVVLSVPRAPRPPPPSPAGDSRKHRGFPAVRSGSSSPRHWGMRGWFHDGANLEEACLRMDGAEVVWPFRNNNISGRPLIQPLPAPLLQDRLIAISQLARDQEHPDVAFPLQPPDLHNCPTRKASLSLMHSLVHDEIDFFCKRVATENMVRKPYINWAVKRVARSLQVLWPRSRTNIFGSIANGLSLPTSDVDLVVCLPPVRNLEPIKEAGILEGRNGIKETCLQHAARYLANQDWVKNDSLKTVENTAIPIIMLVVEVHHDLIVSSASNVQSPKEEPTQMSGEQDIHVHSSAVLEESAMPKSATKDAVSIRIDISFKSPSHTGFQTTQLVKDLTEQFPAATPLALVLKQFLADRSLDQSYSGGLSSYCLVLLVVRFLQHEYHLSRPINQNYGNLLMNFLYFFGNVFDPRQMRISVQGSGVYIKRERGCSIDPIHIDDPLFPSNNVGRNCFRIHQCIKAFSEAYSILENELPSLPTDGDACSSPPYRLLAKIIPSIDLS